MNDIKAEKTTLLEELRGHFLAPLFAQFPGSAGVTDVRTLQGHLGHNRAGSAQLRIDQLTGRAAMRN